MFKTISACLLFLSSLAAFAFGNQDVVQLLAAGMDEKTVADAITNANPATFDTSANGLIALKNAGASPTIIQKVIVRQGANNAPVRTVSSATDAACQIESVGMADKVPLRVDGKIIGLLPEKYEVSNDADMGSAILSGLTFGIAKTHVSASLVIPGNRALIRISDKTPEFVDVLLLPDRSPDDQVFLVHMTVKDSSRSVQIATVSKNISGTRKRTKDFGQNVQIPMIREKVEELCTWRGVRLLHFRMKPDAPLASGEYGYILGDKIYGFGVD